MLEKFNSYYQNNKLFVATDKILLAISGGKDSITMLHFFKQHNLSFGVAHCNFQLRGADAVKDEQFVAQFCEENNITFHKIGFNTEEYASEKGISIQMAARELRYDWFEKIREEKNYQYIATAHHKNDVAETMLINLTKGTGLAGLHGIPNKNGKVIRPMLCFNSIEIDDYITENKIDFREDTSNADNKYTRNLIRHQIIPKLEKINPALIETLNNEACNFLDDEKIIAAKILEEKERLFIENENDFSINIEELKKLAPLKSYLYYFLRDYGFNGADAVDIAIGLDGQSGQLFYSKTHQIVKDREYLLLKPIVENLIKKIEISSLNDFPFTASFIDITADFEFQSSNEYAYLDADKIQFPMTLRGWEQGDTFQPLGMKGNKKVSDYLIDNKVSVVDKQKVRVLELEGEILWLVGHRINDNFKITPSTKRALILSI
jgi:tRNA(Ile)-lysidine synthase